MNVIRERGEHVESLLGAYAIDAVDEDERRTVAEHLRGCQLCRDDLAYIIDVPVYLSILTPADVEDLRPAPSRQLAGSGAAVIPIGHARRRVAFDRTWALAAAAAVLVVAAGLGGWLLLPGLGAAPAQDQTVVAQASGGNLGINVSVSLTPHAGGLGVQASMRGLDAGARYHLVVVTGRGQTLTVSDVVGQAGEQLVRGDVPVSLADVSFFALVRDGAGVVLTVPFSAGAAPAASPGGS